MHNLSLKSIVYLLFVAVVTSCGSNGPEIRKKDKNGRFFSNIYQLRSEPINYNALTVQVGHKNIFVVDKSGQRVVKYDFNLGLLGEIGRPGPAPHELNDIRTATPIGVDQVAVFDKGQNAIKLFSVEEGELLDFYKLPFRTERAEFYKGSETCLLQRTGTNFTLDFYLLQRNGEEWETKEDLSIDSSFHDFPGSSIRDDGFFCSNLKGDIAYVSYLSVNSFLVDIYGRIVLAGTAVHDIVNPEVVLEERFAAPGNSEIYVLSVAISNDGLYVLSRLPDDYGNLVVDQYQLADLQYETSYAAPFLGDMGIENLRSIAVKGDTLYSISENHITSFKMERQ